MKRSEVVKFIHWFLNDQLHDGEDGDGTGDIAEECASDLLEHLQLMGMLPPLNMNNPKPNFYKGKEHGYTFPNEWEKE